jgi:SAM-dependent methyltransferase
VGQAPERKGSPLASGGAQRKNRTAGPTTTRAAVTRDRELEAGSLAHYADADYYTSAYRRRIDDVQFYVGLAERFGGPVLEYGVGNGRIALPLARHGIQVTGVDHSPAMLADLRERLIAEPREIRARVKVRRGDMRSVRLHRRFPLIACPFNAALHLYARDDVERFLANVRAHLSPGGLFVVDLAMPSLADLLRPPTRAYPAPRFRYPGTGEIVKYRERYDYDCVRQILFVSTEFEPVEHPEKGWVVPLAHRQFFPREWEALLYYNGFAVERVEGDFHGGPLVQSSDVMVWYARRRT